MKLLFDQNLSFRLVEQLAAHFPGSVHVRDVGLARALDQTLWHYAATHGLALVSKDADFQQRSLLMGHPPKVVWIRLGNCTTETLVTLLRVSHTVLDEFMTDPLASFLALR